MVELTALSACAGLLPVEIGTKRLTEVDLGHLTTIAPFTGQSGALSKRMKSAHGVEFPAPNQALEQGRIRVIWFGRDMALLCGPKPDAALATHAALTDQTDAWACVALEGAGSDDVLARLVPVDLRASSFKSGQTVRSQILHMNGCITRTAQDSVMLMVFRSMAGTLVHEVKEAMAAVAARG